MTNLPKPLDSPVRELRDAVRDAGPDGGFLVSIGAVLVRLCRLLKNPGEIEPVAVKILDSCGELHEEFVACARARRAPETSIAVMQEQVDGAIRELCSVLPHCECSQAALMSGLGWTARRRAY